MGLLRFETLSENALRGTATDVDDQAATRVIGQVVCDAEVDETRLFLARNDVDRMAEGFLRLRDEAPAVAHLAHRVGAHGTHRAVLQVAQPLTEALQARQRSDLRLRIELALRIESVREHDELAQLVDDVDAPVDDLRDEHVETVRAEVDGGDVVRGTRSHARSEANGARERKPALHSSQ